MWLFNSAIGKLFELIFFPVRNLNPWFGMVLISLLTALLMLAVFRFTSNQKGIRRVKDRIKAHLLELRLYKDNLSQTLKAQAGILRSNLTYLGYSMKPLLVMIIPLILILIQLNLWFGYRSFNPEEEVTVKITTSGETNLNTVNIAPVPEAFCTLDAPPLRIGGKNEIYFRLRFKEKGIWPLTFALDGQKVFKTIAVAQRPLVKITPLRVRPNIIDELFSPGEAPLPQELPLKLIEVKYPARKMNLFGLHLHWLIVYFALSIIFGFALKGVLKVEV